MVEVEHVVLGGFEVAAILAIAPHVAVTTIECCGAHSPGHLQRPESVAAVVGAVAAAVVVAAVVAAAEP